MYPSDPRINEHHCASSLTSQLAVVFRGAALPVRRLQRGSLTTSVNQPDRGGGGGGGSHPLAVYELKTLPRQTQILLCNVAESKQDTVLSARYQTQHLPFPWYHSRPAIERRDGRGDPAVSNGKPHAAAAVGRKTIDWYLVDLSTAAVLASSSFGIS